MAASRIRQLLAGGAALVAVAGWRVAIVVFTPAGDRPYVSGTSFANSTVCRCGSGSTGYTSGK